MTSPRAKGNAYQRWVCSWLERQQFVVHNETPRTRMVAPGLFASVDNDIFGAVDIIAKKKDLPTIWIQATMDSAVAKRVAAFRLCPFNEHDLVYIFQKTSALRHRIFEYRYEDGSAACIGEIISGKLQADCWPFRTPDKKERVK